MAARTKSCDHCGHVDVPPRQGRYFIGRGKSALLGTRTCPNRQATRRVHLHVNHPPSRITNNKNTHALQAHKRVHRSLVFVRARPAPPRRDVRQARSGRRLRAASASSSRRSGTALARQHATHQGAPRVSQLPLYHWSLVRCEQRCRCRRYLPALPTGWRVSACTHGGLCGMEWHLLRSRRIRYVFGARSKMAPHHTWSSSDAAKCVAACRNRQLPRHTALLPAHLLHMPRRCRRFFGRTATRSDRTHWAVKLHRRIATDVGALLELLDPDTSCDLHCGPLSTARPLYGGVLVWDADVHVGPARPARDGKRLTS